MKIFLVFVDMSSYSVIEQAKTAAKFLKIFGFGTFTLTEGEIKKVVVSPFDYYFLIKNIFICFLIAYLTVRFDGTNFQSSKLVVLGALTAKLGGSFTTLTSILRVFMNRHKICNCIVKIDEISVKFHRVNVEVNFRRTFLFFIVSLNSFLVYILLGLFLMYFLWGYDEHPTEVLVFGYLSSSFSFSMMWTTMFHISIFLRLKLINTTIETMIVKSRSRPKKPLKNSDKVIFTLKEIHLGLMGAVGQVNAIFGFQTMLCVGLNFLFNLFSFLVAYKSFYFGEKLLLNSAYTTMYWTSFYTAFTFLIIFTCNRVDSENSKIRDNICRLTNRNVCTPIVLEAFGHQVKIISGKSSCGLFNFDYSLIMMVSNELSKELIALN